MLCRVLTTPPSDCGGPGQRASRKDTCGPFGHSRGAVYGGYLANGPICNADGRIAALLYCCIGPRHVRCTRAGGTGTTR
jgi:hypothetical protein